MSGPVTVRQGPHRLVGQSTTAPGWDESIVRAIERINFYEAGTYLRDESKRKRYLAVHPTSSICLGCMEWGSWRDMTRTPTGVTRQLQALGGKFRTFWPDFIREMRDQADLAMQRGVHNLVFVSYHYSASGTSHLNCAGHGYNTKQAHEHATELARDLTAIFGDQVVPIVTGMETDQDMLILHGERDTVTGEQFLQSDYEATRAELRRAFPRFDDQIIDDLTPFMQGNAERVAELKRSPRVGQALDHDERIIVVGNRCEWLTQSNLALVIHHSDPNLDEAICVAADILEKNLSHAGANGDVAIFTNIEYERPGTDGNAAIAQATGLLEFALRHIRDRNPGLWRSERLKTLSGVTFGPTKQLQIIERGVA